MTCELTLDAAKIRGLRNSAGNLSRIILEGTVSDCSRLKGSIRQAPDIYAELGETVFVITDGIWSVDFSSLNYPFQCGREIDIEVSCDDPGSDCEVRQTVFLNCDEAVCPSYSLIELRQDELCDDCGYRDVTFKFRVTPGSRSDISAMVYYVNSAGTIVEVIREPVLAGVPKEISTTFKVEGGWSGNILVREPSMDACPAIGWWIDVGDCTKSKCPEVSGFSVTPEMCSDGRRKRTLSVRVDPGMCTGFRCRWRFRDDLEQYSDWTNIFGSTIVRGLDYEYPFGSFTAVLEFEGRSECDRNFEIVAADDCECTLDRDLNITDIRIECGSQISRLHAHVRALSPVHVTLSHGVVPLHEETTTEFVFDRTMTLGEGVHNFTLKIDGHSECLKGFSKTVLPCSETPSTDEESDGCGTLRWAMVVAASLTILALIVSLCTRVPLLGWIQAIGWSVTAGLFLAWFLGCDNKPCKWGLLFAAQIAITVGYTTLYFSSCCLWLVLVSAGFMALGIRLFQQWKNECNYSQCRVKKEIASVIAGAVFPLISYLLIVFRGCANLYLGIGLSLIVAWYTRGAIFCIDRPNLPRPNITPNSTNKS